MPTPLHSPEQHLADLGFRRIRPAPALQPYIESYWHFHRAGPLTAYREEFMHPRGGFGLVFNFGDSLHLDGQPLHTPIFLDGVNTVSRKLGFFGRVDLMGVRFTVGGAYPFLSIPLVELQNEVAVLDALSAPPLLELYAKLHDARRPAQRVHLLDGWLHHRLNTGRPRDPRIPASLARLQHAQHAHLPIPNLAREFAISQRHLERLYRIQVGLSPRQYAQLLRIDTARIALKRAASPSLTHLALDLGFYDQPHFIREFKAVIGMTPRHYRQRHHPR